MPLPQNDLYMDALPVNDIYKSLLTVVYNNIHS